MLVVAAFDELQRCIVDGGGDLALGIEVFCGLNGGEGWLLPETLVVADLGMERTVDVGVYDERARTPQPVASALGPRFYDWQFAQTPAESWAECERHAAILRGEAPAAPPAAPSPPPVPPRDTRNLGPLFGGGVDS